jgi:hypothetical protein
MSLPLSELEPVAATTGDIWSVVHATSACLQMQAASSAQLKPQHIYKTAPAISHIPYMIGPAAVAGPAAAAAAAAASLQASPH